MYAQVIDSSSENKSSTFLAMIETTTSLSKQIQVFVNKCDEMFCQPKEMLDTRIIKQLCCDVRCMQTKYNHEAVK